MTLTPASGGAGGQAYEGEIKRAIQTGSRSRFRLITPCRLDAYALLCLIIVLSWSTIASASTLRPPRVLLIMAHPDDETMFTMGRFRERGWLVSIALVTNGENGQVVQGIKPHYVPAEDEDILIERTPGPGTWLTIPPDGPRLREIRTHTSLAREWRSEFLKSMSRHGVVTVFFLSEPAHTDFEDSWDNRVVNWNKALLTDRLQKADRRVNPDIIITLNPDETRAHPQHIGLARIVKSFVRAHTPCGSTRESASEFFPDMPESTSFGVWTRRQQEKASTASSNNFLPAVCGAGGSRLPQQWSPWHDSCQTASSEHELKIGQMLLFPA